LATADNTLIISAAFARDAHRLVESGRVAEAVQLCAQGIQAYPDYCTGYLVMASAYAAAGLEHDRTVMMREYHKKVRSVELRVTKEVTSDELQVTSEVTSDELRVTSDERGFFSPLQVIHTVPSDTEQRKIRSSSVRLIPGLEYTSLRFEGMKMRGVRVIQHLADPPSFRDFHIQSRRPSTRGTDSSATAQRKRPLSLEELALRLEKVRMPRSGEVSEPFATPPPSSSPSTPLPVITETLAKIYAGQGSYELAIEAYRILQQRLPEKADQFATTIEELRSKL